MALWAWTEAGPSSGKFAGEPQISEVGKDRVLQINTPDRTWRFKLNADRKKPDEPILLEVK